MQAPKKKRRTWRHQDSLASPCQLTISAVKLDFHSAGSYAPRQQSRSEQKGISPPQFFK
jgi:hypothetical protein